MKKYLPDIAAIIFILCIIGIFFFPFFFPEPKLLVTPDFGRSDSWHFSIPTKFLLWQNLKENRLPLWSPGLGGGFPVFAEGQIGALYPLNLILFKFFDFTIAYNLALAASVGIFSLGTYILLRVITNTRLGSLLGAISIAFSGIVVPQLPHITLLEGLSCMPWILLAIHCLIQRITPARIASLAVLLALQIFAGFPQATFITLLFGVFYLLWRNRPWERYIKTFVAFICALFLGISLAAIQIIPSYEFLRQSSASKGFSADIASYYSYPWKHLITLLAPFALGNPAIGTYPYFATFDGSIFWENSGFIGWVPLFFAGIAIIGLLKRKTQKQHSTITFFLITAVLSLVLMTGSHSPLYLIFSIWPFNLFRVPSRFIWIFILSILALAAHGISSVYSSTKTQKKKILLTLFIVALILSNVIQLQTTWHNYHVLVSSQEWLATPKILTELTPNGKLYTIGIESTHNEFFTKNGWSTIAPYKSLRNALLADSNVFWNTASTHVYAGRFLARSSLLESLLISQINLSNHVATISALGEKLLILNGTTDVITTWLLHTKSLIKKFELAEENATISLYQNPNALAGAYLADEPIIATTLSQAVTKMNDSTFHPGHSVIVHQPISGVQKGTGVATIINKRDEYILIRVQKNSTSKILVNTDTYYPGWYATIDGTNSPIFPVNIAQRGLLVPAGNHEIVLSYQPNSLKIGALVSLTAGIVTLLLGGYPFFAGLFRKRQTDL